MLGDLSRVSKIYIVTGRTDMRKSIDGLMSVIRDTHAMDPFANALYLFCGRKTDRIKALHYDQTGFVVLYKRICGPVQKARQRAISVAAEFFRSTRAHQAAVQVAP